MEDLKNKLLEEYKITSNMIDDGSLDELDRRVLVKERAEISEKILIIEKSLLEDKNNRIKNYITIGTFTVSTLVTLYGISKTFRFDSDGVITSTLGKNILNTILPKK